MMTRYLIRILVATLIFGSISLPVVAAPPSPKINIFYLNSYHDGYPWSDNMTKGVREVIEKSGKIIQLQIEFLNSKKYYDRTIKENLFRHFMYKFRNKVFDVIIVTDNNALEFILEYGQTLFPDIPVIFAGINDYRQYQIPDGMKITGVIESIFFRENLELARRLSPDVEKMIVIGNNSVTSKSISDQVKDSIRRNKIDFDIQFRNDLRSEGLIESLKHEPKKTMLYIIPAYEEIQGEFYSSWELTQKVFEATGLPVYGSWEFIVGYGMVGGKVASAHEHGRTAARLALRILDGEDTADIPYIINGGHKYLFDHKVLEFFRIDRKLLPEDSVIINEPFTFYRLNRTIFWFIVTSVALLLIVVVLLFFNTTQRKRANIALSESRSKLRMILDNVPQIVFWQDRELRFMDVNQAFLDFFEIQSYDDIIGSDNYDLLGDVLELDRVIKTNHDVIRTEKPQYRIRWQIQRRNQDIIWLEVNKIPFHDESGTVVGVLTTAEDITKQLDLEKQLRQSQKMEALGILSGGIAHDFNNILTSIINSAELAMEDVSIGSITRKDLKRIFNAGMRGSNLVKQILTFSKPSSQEFRLLNMINTVSESMEIIRSSLPKNIDFREEISRIPIFCKGHPTQIHQIVMNLCTNSFQAMKDSGGSISIQLKEVYVENTLAEQMGIGEGQYAELSVSDDGPGIDNDILDKIFDPFFSTKSKNIGTGLGLSVVHGIVKGHNGAIHVTSNPKEGTRFKVYIPQVIEHSDEQIKSDTYLNYGYESILFVEDDPDQRDSVPRALASLGYRVVTAEDAEEGLIRFSSNPQKPDLVITDYDMPNINGFEFADRLREISPETPVIMVSGRQFDVDGGQHPNIRQLIVKPYDKIRLSGAIRQVMNDIAVNPTVSNLNPNGRER